MNHDLAHCDAQYYIFNKYGECEERHCSLKKKCKRHKAFLDLNGDETSPIAFISAYECAPVYYDKNGVFDVTKRLGCLCCPLKGDKGLADFKKYPKFVRLWIRGGAQFIDNHKDSETAKKYKNAYNRFFRNLFCNSDEDYMLKTTGLFGNLDCKQFLEDYFKIDLP